MFVSSLKVWADLSASSQSHATLAVIFTQRTKKSIKTKKPIEIFNIFKRLILKL